MKKNLKKLATLLVCCLAAASLACVLSACSSSGTDEEESTESEEAEEEEADEEEAEEEADEGESTEETADDVQGAEPNEDGVIDEPAQAYADGSYEAVVTVEDYGSFTIELDSEAAPVSAANFAALADSGYYDGLAFYRTVEDFCLQGGTLGNSTSGSDSSLSPIVGEFSENGVENELADNFEEGVVAMARTSEADSATSTFFITLASDESVSQSLDGQYAAFGTIDEEGMEVVQAMVEDTKDKVDDSGMGVIEDEADMPVIESIEIVEQ